jgi:anaerobic magnesium-protoporphyrin IX monomethyl ester cyclase
VDGELHEPCVLIVTGGLVTEKETSIFHALRKQLLQRRFSKSPWLDHKIKLTTAEPLISGLLERKSVRDRDLRKRYFDDRTQLQTPELTEVVLATLLRDAGVSYRLATYSELFEDKKRAHRLLEECDCVFASTTLLRDLSEVEPLVRFLHRSHNHIVLGGALSGLICDTWSGMSEVDVMCVGYGELLIPALVTWMQNGYEELLPPEGGRIVDAGPTRVVHSGVPFNRDLDFLTTPDWALSASDREIDYNMTYYESVRGCPFRCAFCNYPYLFDDVKFRYKSALKIVDDWERYARELNVEYITCLDSLFTMPKRRLREFCELMIERKVPVKWICYARADDLADESIVILMKQAGAHQVQIGIESGHQTILDNMNKVCTVEANAKALLNCRKHGLTTVVSMIVGYPGETEQTLQSTYEFLRESPPDFYYLATFSTRAAGVPVLNPVNRKRFGLETADNSYCMAPYWQHASMSCTDVGNHVRRLNNRLMRERVSLNATLFYSGLLNFQPTDREALLDFQQRVSESHSLMRAFFNMAHRWVDKRLQKDVRRWFTERPVQDRKPAA